MTDFALKALEFGVIGLCALTLVMVWRLLKAEQARDGYPRKGILQSSYAFMAFSLLVAILNAWVQLSEGQEVHAADGELQAVGQQLQAAENRIEQIRTAAGPLLNVRQNILQGMPDGPNRTTLLTLTGELQKLLK